LADGSLAWDSKITAKEVFHHTSIKLRKDRDVVMAVTAIDGDLLEFAAMNMRADPHVVMAAIKTTPLALLNMHRWSYDLSIRPPKPSCSHSQRFKDFQLNSAVRILRHSV
jgi:hypothetical protein